MLIRSKIRFVFINQKIRKEAPMVQSHQYKVLLIGSGLMTPPLVDYLCKFGDTHITVASNILEDG